MLKIDRQIISAIRSCDTKEGLRVHLQNAVELEHATIPPYLTAMYSLLPGANEKIAAKLRDLGDGAFVAGADRQVLSWFGDDRVFPIVDVRSAERAIDIIVVEGEGTQTDPFESPGRPAHYYRFGEIYHGRKFVKDGSGFA